MSEKEICTVNKINSDEIGPIIIYINSDFSTGNAKLIYESVYANINKPLQFYEVIVSDWDRYLTPWSVDKCLGDREFVGCAGDLLKILENEVLPEILDVKRADGNIYIAGYSLAGLFALWTLYNSKLFNGAVCCSGSLWYPKWLEYIDNHSIDPDRLLKVYMSLGNKEENTKHPLMRMVGENTRKQAALFMENEKVDYIFEINEGGHFSDVPERIISGISWIISD